MPALLIGVHCRLCRALIPSSIAGQPLNVAAAKMAGAKIPTHPSRVTYGWEASGYLCEKCLHREQENMRKLAASAEAFWVKNAEIDMPGIAPPCAICGTIEGDTRVFDDYCGAKAFMCLPCGDAYLLANRDKIRGTLIEWERKLK